MHRTQISLENEQYDLLTHEARRRRISLSAVLRELVDARYRRKGSVRQRKADPLAALTGLGAGTGEPVGRQHNRFLYGRKSR